MGSSPSAKVALVKRYPSSRSVTSIKPSMTGSQFSLYFVSLGLPSKCKRPCTAVTVPSSEVSMRSTTALPQCISVTSSPALSTWQSSRRKYTALERNISLVPTSGFLGCKFSALAVGVAGAPAKLIRTAPAASIAQYRGMTGSIFCLLIAQILSHDIELVFLEAPCVITNSFKASTVSPRRRTPRTVGILGSSQPVTVPWSTNLVNFRFDRHV
mmetsp:Transcript_55294/g.168111  ORF Transcript_55294/g.168111 Transcript_55294/m.168111 type:complete len:213 (+) Transcript_55294:222-860(+)